MVEEGKVGMVDRFKGFFKERPITPSERVDRFVTRKLPDYVEDYKLATRSDLKGVDDRIEEFASEITKMKQWKERTQNRHMRVMKKIERLEKKYDLEDD